MEKRNFLRVKMQPKQIPEIKTFGFLWNDLLTSILYITIINQHYFSCEEYVFSKSNGSIITNSS